MGNTNCCAAQKPKIPANQSGKRPIRQPGGDQTLPEINKKTPQNQTTSQQQKLNSDPLIIQDDLNANKDSQVGKQGRVQLAKLAQIEQTPTVSIGISASTFAGVAQEQVENHTKANENAGQSKEELKIEKVRSRVESSDLRDESAELNENLVSVVIQHAENVDDGPTPLAASDLPPSARHPYKNKQGSLNYNTQSSTSAHPNPNSNPNPFMKQSIDLSLPQTQRKQIYRITNEFPFERPYSLGQEWQNLLDKNQVLLQNLVDERPIEANDDQLADDILTLSNRNWIREQISLHVETQLSQQDSLNYAVKQRKAIQLREHFNWLVWAVAQYYFEAPNKSTLGRLDTFETSSVRQETHQMTQGDQDLPSFEDNEHSFSAKTSDFPHPQISQISQSRIASATHKPRPGNQLAQSVAETRQTVFNCKLPKTQSAKWSEGFNFKGVFFRVMPYEDARHILDEIKALKYAQTEILDIQTTNQTSSQEKAYERMAGRNPQKNNLHNEIIFPLLAGVKCCGFYLYGTPLIYTQEVQQSLDENANNLNNRAADITGQTPFEQVQNNESLSEEEGFLLDLPRFSSVTPGVGQINLAQIQRHPSFAYLHDNIEEDLLNDPCMKRMPILKNILRRNLIPILDFEELNSQQEEIVKQQKQQMNQMVQYGAAGTDFRSVSQVSDNKWVSTSQVSGVSLNSHRSFNLGTNLQVCYLLVYLSSSLRSLSTEASQSVLFTIPSLNSEEIEFHSYPLDKQIKCQFLYKQIYKSIAPGPGTISQKPLGGRYNQPRAPDNALLENKSAEDMFKKRFFTKHGWRFYLIEKTKDSENKGVVNASGLVSFSRNNENKRATNLFQLRENEIDGVLLNLSIHSSQFTDRQRKLSSVYQKRSNSISKKGIDAQIRQGSQVQGQNNGANGVSHNNQITSKNDDRNNYSLQQINFVPPNKKTLLRRNQPSKANTQQTTQQDDIVSGNCVVAAIYSQNFKVKYSMTANQYGSGIETLFRLSIDSVVAVLDQSDRIQNVLALKQLMHRKGLNMRFLWILILKVKLKQARDLIMSLLLCSVLRKIVNEEIKMRSEVKATSQSQILFGNQANLKESGSYNKLLTPQQMQRNSNPNTLFSLSTHQQHSSTIQKDGGNNQRQLLLPHQHQEISQINRQSQPLFAQQVKPLFNGNVQQQAGVAGASGLSKNQKKLRVPHSINSDIQLHPAVQPEGVEDEQEPTPRTKEGKLIQQWRQEMEARNNQEKQVNNTMQQKTARCHYQGNQQTLFKEILVLFINILLKKKFQKFRQVFEEILLGVFLSRLKIMSLAASLDLKQAELNFLESKNLLDMIVQSPSENPTMFLNSIESYFNLTFQGEFTRKYRQDKYFHLISKPQNPISIADIAQVRMQVQTHFTLRDTAYFILARKIAFNNKLRQSQKEIRNSHSQALSQRGSKEQSQLAKIFQKPQGYQSQSLKRNNNQQHNMYDSQSSFSNLNGNQNNQASFMNYRGTSSRVQSGFNSNQQFVSGNGRNRVDSLGNVSMMTEREDSTSQILVGKSKMQGNEGRQTQRKWQDSGAPMNNPMQAHGNQQIGGGVGSNYRHMIDLSRKRKVSSRVGKGTEILLPDQFYKLHTDSSSSLQQSANYYSPNFNLNINSSQAEKKSSSQANKANPFLNNLQIDYNDSSTNANANADTVGVQSADNSILMPYYEMPCADVINEWVIVLESLLTDVYSVHGCQQVLLEALVYQCLITLFVEQDADSAYKVLSKIRDHLFSATVCQPELIVMCMALTGIIFDAGEELDQFPVESEKNYLAGLILAFQVLGDPRGRGNFSSPYCLFFAWKLSLLSLADGKKIGDSELAEEIFDATLSSLYNHKRLYRSHQIELMAAQEQAHSATDLNFSNNLLGMQQQKQTSLTSSTTAVGGDGVVDKNAFGSNDNPLMQNVHVGLEQIKNGSTGGKLSQGLFFEMALEQLEKQKNHFDIKQFKKRPKNVVTAGGFMRAGPNVLSQTNIDLPLMKRQRSSAGTKSEKDQKDRRSTNNNCEFEVSDEDPDINVNNDDEECQRLKQLNFRKDEAKVGKLPFTHWTINRTILSQQMTAIQHEKNQKEARNMQKELVRDLLTQAVDSEALLAWMVNYNPMSYPSGLQWGSKTIKEMVFYQNQQIASNSEPSSIAFSRDKLSQYSYRSVSEGGTQRRRRQHMGPYSQFLAKDAGGICKSEIQGLIYAWGTDQFGQLGLENFVAGKQLGSLQSLKLLHPRMLIPLKNELIKEVCCGYAHTLALNHYGQVFAWGHNNYSQLGLGKLVDQAPEVVRKPVMIPALNQVQKIAAGHEHSLALTKKGQLFSWGSASMTGLGYEDPEIQEGAAEPTTPIENIDIPTCIDFFSSKKIQQISVGGLHTVVITTDGNLYTWGSNDGGQLGISATTSECAVSRPRHLNSLQENNQKVRQVSCGEAHTVILTVEGKVWGWGMSNYGQLGLGFSGDNFEPGLGMAKSKVPEPVEITEFLPEYVRVVQVVCGAAFTMFLTSENELYGCGINDLGQLGLDTYLEEMQIAVLDRARMNAKVAQMRELNNRLGQSQSQNASVVSSSGGGAINEMSFANVVSSDVTVPSRVICFEGLKVNAVSCGENHSLALIGEERSVWAWGMYRNGQLGLGEVNQKMNPRPIQQLHQTKIHRLAAGSQHSMALLGDASQLQALTLDLNTNQDALVNPWIIDFRKLSQQQGGMGPGTGTRTQQANGGNRDNQSQQWQSHEDSIAQRPIH